MMLHYARLLLALGLSGPSIAKSVCKRISDGEIVDGVSEQEINDCYACKGWHKVEEENAFSVLQSLPDTEVLHRQEYQWCGETTGDRFEVIFRRPIKFAGFTIRASKPDAWVNDLEVWYGDDSNELSRARNAAAGEVFQGNVNERITNENKFSPPITATFIRIVPKSYESRPCFRINFYSCKKQKMESDEMSEEDDCPPFECDIKCLVFLEDEYGCKTCACDRTNPGLLEGDIRIDPSTIKDVEIAYGIREDPPGIMRGGMSDDSLRWVDYPSGGNYIIPYVVDGTFSSAERLNFAAALQEIEDASCLRFRERTNQQYYIRFIKGSGCYSYFGNIKRTSGGQEISLGWGCLNTRGVTQHEVLHALGFWHEQSRKDRDNYVTILTQNIIPGKENNFEKRDDTRDFGSPYDFDSVMHYSNKAYTGNGEDTIQAKSNPSMKFGQRVKFSTEDIKQLQRMYQCDGPVTTTTSTTTTQTTTVPTTTAPTTTPRTTTTPTNTAPTTTAPTTTTPTTTTPTTNTPTTITPTTTPRTTTTPTTTAPTTTAPTTTTPTTTTPTINPPTTITATTTTSTPCTDRRRRRHCRKLRRKGNCNRKSVKRKCAKTCGLCE